MTRREAKRRANLAGCLQIKALVASEYLLAWEGRDRERMRNALEDLAWELFEKSGDAGRRYVESLKSEESPR